MVIKNLSRNTLDFFKKHGENFIRSGKNIACIATAVITLIVPCKAKVEDKKLLDDNICFEERVNDELIIIVSSEWKKTENYSDGKGPVKENREYQRTVRRIKTNENYNEDFFNGDYQKLLEVIRDNNNFDQIFEIVEERNETIIADEDTEKNLNQKYWTLEIEGTDIKEAIINPNLDHEIKNNIAETIFFTTPFVIMLVGLFAGRIVQKKKEKRK